MPTSVLGKSPFRFHYAVMDGMRIGNPIFEFNRMESCLDREFRRGESLDFRLSYLTAHLVRRFREGAG